MVQTSKNGSNISPTQGQTNGTYSPVTSDPIIQTSTNASHNDSYMTTIQGDVTVTRNIAMTRKIITSTLLQTTEKLTYQTYVGHVTEENVQPIRGQSSIYLDDSSRIAIGSSMAGLVVFGMASIVVYRLVCIRKKIIPAAAR